LRYKLMNLFAFKFNFSDFDQAFTPLAGQRSRVGRIKSERDRGDSCAGRGQ